MSEGNTPKPESPANNEGTEENALLFDVWDASEMEYTDPGMSRYIKVTPITHTVDRHASKRLQKPEISIVRRLASRLMQTGDNTGHKQETSKTVKSAFEIVNERTKENPVQVLIHAVEDAGPREGTVRLKYSDISVPQVADAAPRRRVDEVLKSITQGTLSNSYKTTTTAVEALAQQLIGTIDYNIQAYATSQREGEEYVAEVAR